jgi:hypothetical protein
MQFYYLKNLKSPTNVELEKKKVYISVRDGMNLYIMNPLSYFFLRIITCNDMC